MTIQFSQIDEGDRARKEYGDLSGLKRSMQQIGQLHSIVLAKKDSETYLLIYGGRRYRAMKELGVTELEEGVAGILEPGKYSYMFKENMSEEDLLEAQLDENLYRLRPKWQEEVVLISDIHRLKKVKEGSNKWGTDQTAELLGKGTGGKKTVQHAVRLAKLIRAGDADIIAAENMSQAMTILFRRKEEEALAELHRRTSAMQGGGQVGIGVTQNQTVSGGNVLSSTAATSSFLDVINRDNPKFVKPAVTEQDEPETTQAPVEVPLSLMFKQGDCLEIMRTLPDAIFDHVVTDIPYGIDMKNLDTRDMSAVVDEHDVAQNVEMMEPFLEQTFRLTKSGGFCVFFYDLDWHEYLQANAEKIGWKVQRWPLIAYKTSTCQNNAAQFNFTKNYECAMVLRRDEHTVLRKQQSTSVWMGDFSAERKLYNNVFAKPFSLWQWIYEAIAFRGQSVLDPYCGEMSACRAAVSCGLIPYGIELKEGHYLRGLQHMQAIYALVHKGNVKFT